MPNQIEVLKARVEVAAQQLQEAKDNLAVAEALPGNNVFETLEYAEGEMYETLRDKAGEDCDCAGECGLEQYVQLFYVRDKLYKATANVEYNRRDKTYYYVDGFDFKVEEVQV